MWIWVLGAYTIVALLFTGQVRLDYAYAGEPIGWERSLLLSGVNWYTWAAFTPAIAWLGRRLRFSRRSWLRALVVHLVTGLGIVVVKTMVNEGVGLAVVGPHRPPASFLQLYVSGFTYWVVLGASLSIRERRDRREREIRASKLETDLARARLETLRLRLHPHFLFNTLNGVLGLMREDVDAADRMLTRLSELLRSTLEGADRPEVPLRLELEFLEKYLEIHRIRFGARLHTEIRAEPSGLDIPVPTLLLQPLVENAFQHGISRKPGPVSVTVEVTRTEAGLEIAITDDGPGPPARSELGTGLDTTRRRLEHSYGNAASLDLERAAGGGARAVVKIPVAGGREMARRP
ncbi:MAG: histidine kinase [Candidatus Eisenbacteria bacterium]